MAKDQQGLPLAGAPESAAAFDRAVADYWGLTGDPVGTLKGALAADPSFALGAIAVADLFMIGGFRGDHPEVTKALAAAEAAIGGASERERRHLAAAKAWASGRAFDARADLGRHHRRPSDRCAGAAAGRGRAFLPRPLARHPRFGGARSAGLGARQSADQLRPRRLRLRPRGIGRARPRRGGRARGAGGQSRRWLGDARARPCVRDRQPAGGGDRLPQVDPCRTGARRISWPDTTAGISAPF